MMWVFVLAALQGMHWQNQVLESFDMDAQRKRDEMRRRVARIPGWARVCMWSKIWRWKAAGMRGRKVPVDVSPMRVRVLLRGVVVMVRDGLAVRDGMEGQVCWAWAIAS